MRCNYCDAEISINSIRCPYCKGLVQIVPDYNPLDDMLSDQINIHETTKDSETVTAVPVSDVPASSKNRSSSGKATKSSSRGATKSASKSSARASSKNSSKGAGRELTEREIMRRKKARMKRLRRRRRNLLLAMAAVLLVIIAVIYLCVSNFSYGGVVKKGYKALNQKEYSVASEKFNSAIEKNSERPDAYKGLSETYLAQGLNEQAEEVFLSYLEKDASNVEIYDSLIQFYIKTEKQEKIPALLSGLDDTILSNLQSYVVELPSFSLDETATYDEVQELSLITDETCKIYYTDNGTVPTIHSKEYKEPILLQEGTTSIKAISVNEEGIPSQVASKSFKVVLPVEDAPAVSPSTGQYNTDIDVEIKVPDGYTAYYTMDGTDPTTASYMYYAPLRMPLGETIFKAVLVNASGKASNITTKNYVVNY